MRETFAIAGFYDVFAKDVTQTAGSLGELAETIRSTTAPTKAQLPLFKLARFGDMRIPNTQSLRHDQNLIACSGIEGDYDGGLISFDEAVERLLKANITALVFTTPSHTEAQPRWRVVAPFSTEQPPQDRARMVDRLNGALGGILAAESWTLSQSYYYGRVEGAKGFQVEIVDGEFIDCLDDLDLTAIGKPAGANGTGANGNGHNTGAGPIDEDELIEAIVSGEAYHNSCIRLIGKWALQEIPLLEAQERLYCIFDRVDPELRDARWADRRADIPNILTYVYPKEGTKRDERTEGKPIVRLLEHCLPS